MKRVMVNISSINSSNQDELIQSAINTGFQNYIVNKSQISRFQVYPSFNLFIFIEDNNIALDLKQFHPIFVLSPPYTTSLEKYLTSYSILESFSSNEFEWGVMVQIENNHDFQDIQRLIKFNPSFIICRTVDWTIIPLENLLASYQNSVISIYFDVGHDLSIVSTIFSTLEHGVDGVVFKPTVISDFLTIKSLQKFTHKIDFHSGVIEEIIEIPNAERVCVDTSSLLKHGEGMLVGNTAIGFVFIHAEVFDSEFVSSRPFRVNAGDVSAYIAVPNKNEMSDSWMNTQYLAELKAGDQVFVVDLNGNLRIVSVGRIKIETRPMRMLKLRLSQKNADEKVIITAQYAETVRLVEKNNQFVSITDLNIGDELKIVYGPGATHFGQQIEENIIEK